MVEGRSREAIALYREAVAARPTDAVSMNNLGYLLAIEEKRYEEGLEWVRRAQKVAGPLPTLRDTEAVILLRMGKPDEAVGLLTDITRESGHPAAHFHLAQAHLALNNRAAATAALDRARRWKIRPIDLPPAERGELDRGMAAHR
jgi:predicted Zn-dependent protease